MRIAIISDVHGNLEAFEAVLAEIDRLGVAEIHSLGDIVGYGPDPAACLEIVRRRTSLSLLGNHDAAVTGATSLEDFNELARWAVEWTVARLTPADRAYLAGLPYLARERGFLFVHATPRSPERWDYIHGLPEAAVHFGDFTERLCLVGHSHRPGVFALDDEKGIVRCPDRELLRPNRRYLVNAGSVGQPRDRDPRASFALYDADRGEISLHRVSYPITETQERMRAEGIPAFLVERLEAGV